MGTTILPSDPALQAALWLQPGRHGWLLAAPVWLLLLLMTVPDGFDYAALLDGGAPTSAGLLTRGLWLLLLLASLLVMAARQRVLAKLLRHLNPWLPVFTLLAIASVGWSIDAGLSLRRVVRLVTIVAVALAFVLDGWQAYRFQQVVRQALSVLLAGSLLFGLVAPEYAIHQSLAPELQHAWRGLTTHKNALGDLACLGFVFWLHAGLSGEVRRLPALAGSLLALTCVVLSRSGTALAMTVLLGALLPALLLLPAGWRRAVPWVTGALVAALLGYALVIIQVLPGMGTLVQPILLLTGKDVTFTGRTTIWALVNEHVARHPLFGTGYGAYWTPGATPGTEVYSVYWRMGAFYPGTGHNGYLDILNDLGIAGLLTLLAYLLFHVHATLRLLTPRYSQAVLLLAVFLQQAIGNLTESHWLNVRSVDMVLMTLASTALAREALDQALRQRYAASGSAPDTGAGAGAGAAA